MNTYLECLPCFANQAVKALPAIEEELHEKVLRDVMATLSEMDFAMSPPRMAKVIFDIIKKHAGDIDFYIDARKKSNEYVLRHLDSFRAEITNADNPFETAVKLAIAGNVIDFGAKHDFSDEQIHDNIESVLSADFADSHIDDLRSEIEKAEKILYLGDNAGEIVFDKLLVELMPREKTVFAVRGKPVINDALMEDAQTVGMTDIVEVIDNGTDIPGTVLEECSPSFRKTFDEADLVISKGQGNYETLSDVDKNIFFLLKIKCPVVARDLGRPLGSFVVGRKLDTSR